MIICNLLEPQNFKIDTLIKFDQFLRNYEHLRLAARRAKQQEEEEAQKKAEEVAQQLASEPSQTATGAWPLNA